MGAPKLIPGGPLISSDGGTPDSALSDIVYGKSKGAFGRHPGVTPKWAVNDGLRDAEYRETMARMFIQMPEQERDKFVSSCPPETRDLAKILCGAGSSAAGGTGFVDFFLQTANESFNEKFQVVESFSDNFVVYTFGQRATPFQYTGMLKNTYQDDQRVWMTRLYLDVLRGTQLARRRKLVRLRYDSVIVSGVLLGLNMTVDGSLVDGVPFNFVLMPTQYTIFTPNEGVPTQLSTPFTEGGQYALSSTAVPNTDQLRVTTPPKGQLPDGVKRKNEKGDNPYADTPTTKATNTKQKLDARVQSTMTPNIDSNVKGGLFYKYRYGIWSFLAD